MGGGAKVAEEAPQKIKEGPHCILGAQVWSPFLTVLSSSLYPSDFTKRRHTHESASKTDNYHSEIAMNNF